MEKIFNCNNCGNFFTESEAEKDADGFYYCPKCGEWDYENAHRCKMCDEPTLDVLCESCFKEYGTDARLIQYGAETREVIDLNPLITMSMDVEEIETVLIGYLQKTGRFQDAANELKMNDHAEFSEWLIKHL